jgi:hypothetical protein
MLGGKCYVEGCNYTYEHGREIGDSKHLAGDAGYNYFSVSLLSGDLHFHSDE